MYRHFKILIFIILSLKLQVVYAIYNGSEFSNIEDDLVFQVQFEQGHHTDAPCSATIISDFTFITAAHCVDKLNISKKILLHIKDEKFEVESLYIPLEYFTADTVYKKSLGTIDEIKYHRNLALFDLAIVNVKARLPESYNRSEPIFQKEVEGISVWVVGAGYTNYNNETRKFYNNPGSTHYRVQELSVLDSEVYMVKGSGFDDYITTPGDSGGSMFIADSNKQIGVLRGSSATTTESASIFTPIHIHQEFIQKFSK
ncbi:MAG: hypothetical protein ACJAS4_000396 [Bacteriovoracaceae bacterium]|jgi:hypothetical protein